MKRIAGTSLFVVMMTALFVLDTPTVEAANPNSSWRWAKPLNERQGLLYTTNKAFKTNSSSRSRTYPRQYRRGRVVQPSVRSVPSSNFFPGRTGLIPFNQVGGYQPFFR